MDLSIKVDRAIHVYTKGEQAVVFPFQLTEMTISEVSQKRKK